ncbi:MAG: hypothetical protein HY075_07250, partial [Deltaproteobacteria bacterium]|nr:hypothetical protein [Deltaproteobacteria bacterium]
KTIHDWAVEKKLDVSAVKAKLAFFGVYPVHMLVYNNLMRINHDSAREGHPLTINEEIIAAEARGRRLPNEGKMLATVARVHELQISDTLYDYAGNLTKHPNETFPPEKWASGGEPGNALTFKGHARERPYLELYYLMSQGEQNAEALLALARCETALTTRSTIYDF